MKVVIDTEKCILAGECHFNHPELFDKSADGVPVVLVDYLTGEEQRTQVNQAIEVCPAGAIALVDSP